MGKVLDLSPRATCKHQCSKTLIRNVPVQNISMSGEEGAPVQRLHKWLPSLADRWLFLASQGLSGSCGPSTPFHINDDVFLFSDPIHFIFDDTSKTKRCPGFITYISCPLSSPGRWRHGLRKRRRIGTRFLQIQKSPIGLVFNKVLVVTGDSEELLGPDAGMFAYNGSEFASWEILFWRCHLELTIATSKAEEYPHHILLGRLIESLVAGELLAGWQTSVELYLLHLNQVWIRSDRKLNE